MNSRLWKNKLELQKKNYKRREDQDMLEKMISIDMQTKSNRNRHNIRSWSKTFRRFRTSSICCLELSKYWNQNMMSMTRFWSNRSNRGGLKGTGIWRKDLTILQNKLTTQHRIRKKLLSRFRRLSRKLNRLWEKRNRFFSQRYLNWRTWGKTMIL